MKNIDFLPDRYQERDLKRKATLWQYALLLGFGSVLLAATLGQNIGEMLSGRASSAGRKSL